MSSVSPGLSGRIRGAQSELMASLHTNTRCTESSSHQPSPASQKTCSHESNLEGIKVSRARSKVPQDKRSRSPRRSRKERDGRESSSRGSEKSQKSTKRTRPDKYSPATSQGHKESSHRETGQVQGRRESSHRETGQVQSRNNQPEAISTGSDVQSSNSRESCKRQKTKDAKTRESDSSNFTKNVPKNGSNLKEAFVPIRDIFNSNTSLAFSAESLNYNGELSAETCNRDAHERTKTQNSCGISTSDLKSMHMHGHSEFTGHELSDHRMADECTLDCFRDEINHGFARQEILTAKSPSPVDPIANATTQQEVKHSFLGKPSQERPLQLTTSSRFTMNFLSAVPSYECAALVEDNLKKRFSFSDEGTQST